MNDKQQIDQRIFDLYDEYCHGRIDRREFLARSAAITIGGVSALWMAQALMPRYAEAQTISFTDSRIRATYVDYDSPGGTSGEMRGYLVQPAGEGPFPAVLVIHENRGLNPHIEDVARRAAVAGFLALAPDGLAPVGGYPGNDDDGRTLQRSLVGAELDRDMINSARFLKSHPLSNGQLGSTGFCWGGGMTNRLAVELGSDLQAGVPFYEDLHGPQMSADWMVTAGWQIGVGYALDRFPRPWLAAPFYLSAVLGLLMLESVTSYPLLLCAGVLMGLGLGTEYGILPYFLSRYFGVRHYGAISGTVYAVILLLQGLAPFLMDLVFDARGSYQLAVIAIAGGLIAGALLILRLPGFPPLIPLAKS